MLEKIKVGFARPMNQFMDIDPAAWEKAESAKTAHAGDLLKQIEEAKAKKAAEKKMQEDDDRKIEERLAKEREQIRLEVEAEKDLKKKK